MLVLDDSTSLWSVGSRSGKILSLKDASSVKSCQLKPAQSDSIPILQSLGEN